jgi:hypothetical protein
MEKETVENAEWFVCHLCTVHEKLYFTRGKTFEVLAELRGDAEKEVERQRRPDTPEREKLAEHQDEWDAIHSFVEWFYGKGYTLATWHDAEALFEKAEKEAAENGKKLKYDNLEDYKFFESHLFEHPYAICLKDLDNLLYEYFGVDSSKLGQERLALWRYIGKRLKKP